MSFLFFYHCRHSTRSLLAHGFSHEQADYSSTNNGAHTRAFKTTHSHTDGHAHFSTDDDTSVQFILSTFIVTHLRELRWKWDTRLHW